MMLVIYILIAVFVLLFTFTVVVTVVARRRERRRIIDNALKKCRVLNLAAAGSEKVDYKTKQVIGVYGLDLTQYKDSQGRVLDPDDYNLFIVDGESMQFCGIHNNDLIFSTKTFVADTTDSFPAVLVVRKNHVIEDYPAYKVRRAWGVINYDSDPVKTVRNLLQSDEFRQVKYLSEYPGDEIIMEDFITLRLPRYENEFIKCPVPDVKDRTVIISTTYNTEKKKIHFSIHPISRVVGKVIASFQLPGGYLSCQYG